jgi:hypothetical protein
MQGLTKVMVLKTSNVIKRAWRPPEQNSKYKQYIEGENKPPSRTAFTWRTPEPCGPDTGNVQDTECLLWATASDALYHGPFTIGSPMVSMTAWFLMAFSKALLQNF